MAKKYLKFIGIVELISTIVGIIAFIIITVIPLKDLPEYKDGVLFSAIFELQILIVFGPSLGILFIVTSKLIDEKETMQFEIRNLRKEIRELKGGTTKPQVNVQVVPKVQVKPKIEVKETPNKEWQCPKCGYINPGFVRDCENCFTKRPNSKL